MAEQLFVNLSLIDVDPDNPRGYFDASDVREMIVSLRAVGQQEPVQLIPQANGRFLLHEGARRLTAMRQLGWTEVWYIERHFASDRERWLSQGTMHIHRANFGEMAWARYLHRLYWQAQMNRQEIAFHLGRSQRWVRQTMSLVYLKDTEQQALTAGLLTKGEALLRLDTRRALKNGTPQPPAPTPAPKVPRQREAHLTGRHPLGQDVKTRCASSGHGTLGRPMIGGVGCGECWEHTIRVDALAAAARPALAAA